MRLTAPTIYTFIISLVLMGLAVAMMRLCDP